MRNYDSTRVDLIYNVLSFVVEGFGVMNRSRVVMSSVARKAFDPARPVSKVEVRFTGHNMDFECRDAAHQWNPIITSAGKGNNPGPMALLTMALGSCAMADIVIILNKMRVGYADLSCEVAAQRTTSEETSARPYENVHLLFSVTSPDLSEGKFARAVELSVEKYCGVHASLAIPTISYESQVKRD